MNTPLGNRPEFHGQPEEGHHHISRDFMRDLVIVAHYGMGQLPFIAFQFPSLGRS